MNKWVLLQPGDHLPALQAEQFVLLAMAKGGILKVMFRFVKNIKGHIAGYLILDGKTISAYDWDLPTSGSALHVAGLMLPWHRKPKARQFNRIDRVNRVYLSH
jgi:hypothetical protein